jgi:Tol biopolymer transport system component
VAYTGEDGIYVARKNGSDKRRVVRYENPEYGGAKAISAMEWPPMPVWSPDGNWLVYHKCELEKIELVCIRTENYVIYKVNVHTGEEVKIIEGGLNPYWRP